MATETFFIYDSGTDNPDRIVIAHSPAFPDFGLLFRDAGADDIIIFQGGGVPVLSIRLASHNVGIGTNDPGATLDVNGDVRVTGDIFLTNADCAEDFDVSETERFEPGTVMVINHTGALQQSEQPYDKRVAGVISGAGAYKAGLVLDRQPLKNSRLPLALIGKVFCKVDAQYGAIEMGDLLTTSPTSGHAMKASDPLKAFGSVIGKSLQSLRTGQGLIPILIALQ